jgi:phosphate/phosphite/phosphonate ABC transporter binding protein
MLCCGLAETTAAEDKLILASIPYRHEATLQEQLQPLADLLSRKLGRAVVIEIAVSYQEIGERLHHRVADIGILGPKSYVEAKEKYPDIIYLATNKNPDAYYNSLIITRKNSGLESLADIREKSFAYTETGSTSGYLYPRHLLKNAGFDPDRMFSAAYFLNTHDKVYDAVAKGSVHAGAASSASLNEAIEKNGDVYHVLATSAPIPRNAVVAGAHLSPDLVENIREILRTAETDRLFSSGNSVSKGFLLMEDAFYDIIRQEREMQ